MSLLDVALALIDLLLFNSTLKIIARNTQLICRDNNACCKAKLHYYYTSIMATIGTMNAAIAQSSDSIQQLMDNRHSVNNTNSADLLVVSAIIFMSYSN